MFIYCGQTPPFKNKLWKTRAAFGPSEEVIVGGSEDGNVYVWDKISGRLLQRLKGHRGVVYHVVWSNSQSLGNFYVKSYFYFTKFVIFLCIAASCSNDGSVKTVKSC